MWGEKIIQFGKELLTLKGQTEKNTNELKKIRTELDNLTEIVKKLAFAMQQEQLKSKNQIEMVEANCNHRIEMMQKDFEMMKISLEKELLKAKASYLEAQVQNQNLLGSSDRNENEKSLGDGSCN